MIEFIAGVWVTGMLLATPIIHLYHELKEARKVKEDLKQMSYSLWIDPEGKETYQIVNDLINWHVEVALDPSVSKDAHELLIQWPIYSSESGQEGHHVHYQLNGESKSYYFEPTPSSLPVW